MFELGRIISSGTSERHSETERQVERQTERQVERHTEREKDIQMVDGELFVVYHCLLDGSTISCLGFFVMNEF